MSVPAWIPPELRRTVFRGSVAVRRGLVTSTMLRGRAWVRLLPDVYAAATYVGDVDPFLLRCQAAAVRMPAGAALSGRAAARIRGVRIGDPDEPVLVLLPGGTRMRGGPLLKVRRVDLPPDDIATGGGYPSTVPLRTALEIAARAGVVDAVADLDVLLRCGYLPADPLSAYTAAHPRSRAARAFRLTDGRAESPQESRLRVALRMAGLPAPVPQYVVLLPGNRLVRLDLAWPEVCVAAEYDGIHHAGYAQLAQDRVRLNALTCAGWTVLHVTAPQLADPIAFQDLLTQLRRLL